MRIVNHVWMNHDSIFNFWNGQKMTNEIFKIEKNWLQSSIEINWLYLKFWNRNNSILIFNGKHLSLFQIFRFDTNSFYSRIECKCPYFSLNSLDSIKILNWIDSNSNNWFQLTLLPNWISWTLFLTITSNVKYN